MLVVNPDTLGWAYVSTEAGQDGYISNKYLAEMHLDATPTERGESRAKTKETVQAMAPGTSNPNDNDGPGILTAYPLYVIGLGDSAWILIGVIFAVELLMIYLLSRLYDYRYRVSRRTNAAFGFIAVAISAALTLCQIAGIFSIRNHASSTDALFALMLLSTGLLMAVIPWRIRISGLYSKVDRSEGTARVAWAGRVGVLTWILLLAPLCIMYLQSGHIFEPDHSNDTFGGMLVDMLIYGGITGAFCWLIWPYVIVKYCLESVNGKLLGILSAIVVFGIAKIGYHMCDASFTGLTYIISLWCLFMISCFNFSMAIGTVNEKRCGHCHTFAGRQYGSTDLGHSYRTHDHWDDIASSSVSRRRSDASVSNARALVRTTYRIDKWKTHHMCPYCYEEWDMDHQSEKAIDHQTLERHWTETHS